ncbi:polyketide synthase dehydratase domain-containing protein, partial [Kitasatospora putterlickiae]|uniref:polyketide synthase dehydratase domain-containing protein n=1 Tax=Kitasatospora putterlickiae TaxID=221725 RepID=UPI0031E44593
MTVHTRPDGDQRAGSTRHCTGWLAPEDTEPAAVLVGTRPPAGAEPLSVDGLYAALAGLGLDCGPGLHGVRAAWRSGAELYADLALPEEAGSAGFGIHPALFEAALHVGQSAFADQGAPKLPVTWSGVRLFDTGATRGLVRVVPDGDTLRLDVFGEDGRPVLSAGRVVLADADPAHLEELRRGQSSLYRVDWAPVALGSAAPVRLAALGSAAPVRLAALGQAAPGVLDRYTDVAGLALAVDGGAAVPQAVLTVLDTPAGDGAAAVV